MTAPLYVEPLAADLTEGRGLVVRMIDAEGAPKLLGKQQPMDCWRSNGDPFSGEGYAIYTPKGLSWLALCFKVMVAEAIHAEHIAGRRKALKDQIEQARVLLEKLQAA